jgi:predicted O-methyltransferase YrrM
MGAFFSANLWLNQHSVMPNHAVQPRHAIPSFAVSVDDDPAAQAWEDWDLVANAVFQASKIRFDCDAEMINVFPGDHYRLLGGLFKCLHPKNLVDVGTAQGLSARAMVDSTDFDAKIATFDIIPYDNKEAFPVTYLTSKDLDSRVTQYLDDIAHPSNFMKYLPLLNKADFIMLDGPKDGVFEERVLELLAAHLKPHVDGGIRMLFLDDIHFQNMIVNWRRIASPKIDLTSFGHFSGSGLIDVTEGLSLLPVS